MPMEIDLGPEAEKFRDELREWLEANRPEDLDPDAAERGPGAAMGAGFARCGPGATSSTRPATCA